MTHAFKVAFVCAACMAITQTGYGQDAPLTAADQCMVKAYREIFKSKAQTAETVEIEIAPIQKTCEETTGTKVRHPDLLKKGPSDFTAGGTRFLFK